MPICVLIIDDCDISRFVAKSLIQNVVPEARVVEAYDGQEAIDLLSKGDAPNPHFTLLDLNMPGMDGFTFLEENNHRGLLERNIFVLSSSTREDDIKKCNSFSSVEKYLTKPLFEKDILSIIADIPLKDDGHAGTSSNLISPSI